MVRIILGVIVGFIVWSIVWVGSEALLASLSPDWLGKHSLDAQKALAAGIPLESANDAGIAIINLIRSFVTSILGGYMAALVAGEYKRSTMALGIILLVVGIMVEYMFWNLAPAWYHILFVLALIPMTILGGRIRRSN
ncbi:MAG: hypothetical protein IPO41_04840 [Acidobacteria bacterium]|nr:hypothetical protein [Acidobacteriota bacterium]MBK9527642.1 hypothetical protein [Acidobacteriota bacterium]MBP7475364.1 hypothetical protein [Pyrinomonadaceae bacterium]MBP9108736.1 hypothetical protein [Pyrinomonadaceae bacterium]